MSFARIGISKEICRILSDKGLTKPTDVQKDCIPLIIEKRDIFACSQTGSGKTATFLIPILQELISELVPMYGLILTPTRELAHQISEQAAGLSTVGGKSMINVLTITGGKDSVRQSLELSRQPHLIIATPGRLADLLRCQINSENDSFFETKSEWSLKRIKTLVLDEADRLLEDNFGPDLSLIISNLPKNRQNLLFSATLTPNVKKACEDAIDAAQKSGKKPLVLWPPDVMLKEVKNKISETLSQHYVIMRAEHKDSFLVQILIEFLNENPHSLVIVFTNKCKWCHLIGLILKKLKISNVLLHSNMPQKERIASLVSFKSSHVRVLVATDLASRGLDIPYVDLVINHNVPLNPKEYIHRVGRTARAGKSGLSITLTDLFEVTRLKKLQETLEKELEAYEVNEKEVAKIIAEVTLARRDAERDLDHINFDEKKDIEKAKRILKRKAKVSSVILPKDQKTIPDSKMETE